MWPNASAVRGAGWSSAAILVLCASVLALAAGPAAAAPIRAVATFSILADLVRQVGGNAVAVKSLVGPDADAHSFAPTPEDAREVAGADIVFVNGLGFEGWLDRLIRASGTRAPVIVVSNGVRTIGENPDHDHDGSDSRRRSDERVDPHAWQSVANAKRYVAAISDGLARVDPGHAALYADNARAYTEKLDALDAEIRGAISGIPEARRRIITSHDAFGYFADAYGLRFIAPEGISTESEAGPSDIARIVRQIRRDRVPAVFLESIADPRLMQQIARESGARIGGRVFSDALSGPDGPAPSYLDMMRTNLQAFRQALG